MVNLTEQFNAFIKKWCHDNYPHLIDSDENDGERFRESIEQLEKALADCNKSWSKLHGEYAELKAELDSAQKRIARLTAHAKAGDEGFEALEKERDEYKEVANLLDNLQTRQRDEIAELKARIKAMMPLPGISDSVDKLFEVNKALEARAGWTENQRQLLIAEANSRGAEILKLTQSQAALAAANDAMRKLIQQALSNDCVTFEWAEEAEAAIQKESK